MSSYGRQLQALAKDDSITFEEEHDKQRELVDAADSSVVDEFKNAKIPLPGSKPPHPPHGPPPSGPHGHHGPPPPHSAENNTASSELS